MKYRLVVERNEVVVEDKVSEDFLIDISKEIITKLSDDIIESHNKGQKFWELENINNIDDFMYSFDIEFSNFLNYNNDYRKFAEFLYLRDCVVSFYYNGKPEQGETIGYYNFRNRQINVRLKDEIMSGYIDDSEYFVKEIQSYLMEYQTTLAHELTHAYDAFISDNKIMNKYKEHKNNRQYYRHNAERNAYYTEIKSMIENDSDIDLSIITKEKYMEAFINLFKVHGGWDFLVRKEQNRIINRIYGEFDEIRNSND